MEAIKLPKDRKKENDSSTEKATNVLPESELDQENFITNILISVEQRSDSEDKGTSRPVRTKRVLDYEYKGERFEIHQKNGKIYINHPEWSLVGMGDTLLDAELDMINDAKLIAEEYIKTPETELSNEAIKFKKYLLNIV